MLFLAFAFKKPLPYVMKMKLNYGQVFVSMGQLLKQEKRLVLRALTGVLLQREYLVLTIALLLCTQHYLIYLLVW
jgi:hypothetical protein